MDKPEVIHTLPTKHRLQGRLFTHLGQPSVELIGDLVAGDGRHRQEFLLLKAEMDALCSWWLAKKGAPVLTVEERKALEFYLGCGSLAYVHQRCTCADCQTARQWEEHKNALRNLLNRMGGTS